MDSPGLLAQRRKRFEREAPSAFQITRRDFDLVRHVAQHRLLRSTHLSALVAAPHKKICDRLADLFHAGYLDRPRAQLDYHVRNGGSMAMVYALDARGARLLRDNPFNSGSTDIVFKKRDVRRPFVLHTLGIADLNVALQVSLRRHHDLKFVTRDNLVAAAHLQKTKLKRLQLGPDIVPDDLFELRDTNDRQRCYFVEVDRATMPVVRQESNANGRLDKSSILRKLMAYANARTRKLHRNQLGWRNFRVLFLTETLARAQSILNAVNQFVPNHRDLFLTLDRPAVLSAPDVLTLPWRNARGESHLLT